MASRRLSLPIRKNRGTQRGPEPARPTANMADEREGTSSRSRPHPPWPNAHATAAGRGLLGRKPRPLLGNPAGRGRAAGQGRGKGRTVIGHSGVVGGALRPGGAVIGCAETGGGAVAGHRLPVKRELARRPERPRRAVPGELSRTGPGWTGLSRAVPER